MATFSKLVLSGSTDGKPIAIAATTTPGTLLHTAHATALDEITLFLCNNTTSSVTVTIEFGGVTTSEQIIITLPPREGDVLVVAGRLLTNSLVVRAYANVAGVNVGGHVNRIAP